MADIRFDEVLKLAEQLPENEQNKLIDTLRLKQGVQKPPPASGAAKPAPDRFGAEFADSTHNPTREELLSAVDALRQTPAQAENRLLGKYANPHLPDMSEEAFHAQMHSIATAWEHELDEFTSDNS